MKSIEISVVKLVSLTSGVCVGVSQGQEGARLVPVWELMCACACLYSFAHMNKTINNFQAGRLHTEVVFIPAEI